jgi:predicted MFS family arabinose efflux permease
VLLFILSLCGFSGALATRLLDPLITSIAADFATSVGVVALLSSAFALPFGLSQPLLGPTGDAFGKAIVIKVAVAVLAACLMASALAPDLTVLFVSRVLGGIAAGGIMPVCMALIGDSFPLAIRQVALSRYIAATLIGQLVGASAGGMIAEWIGWRGVLACAAALALIAAAAAIAMLPRADRREAGQLNVGDALARYRLVLGNPRSFVCFAIVFLEGFAIYGIMPFIGDLLRSRGAGGLREAGFVIGGLGIGGLLYASVVPLVLRFATRPALMAAGGGLAALGSWASGWRCLGRADGLHDRAGLRLLSSSTTRSRPRSPSSRRPPAPRRSRSTPSASSWGRRSAPSCTGPPCRGRGPDELYARSRGPGRDGRGGQQAAGGSPAPPGPVDSRIGAGACASAAPPSRDGAAARRDACGRRCGGQGAPHGGRAAALVRRRAARRLPAGGRSLCPT